MQNIKVIHTIQLAAKDQNQWGNFWPLLGESITFYEIYKNMVMHPSEILKRGDFDHTMKKKMEKM